MDKLKLKSILLDQKESFNSRKEKLIGREVPLDGYIKTSQVVIISGIRRCGKSSLLYLIKEKMQLAQEDYLYFNFDDERISATDNILDLLFNLHIEIYGNKPIIFFDEIQNIKGWEKFINRIYEQGIKIFVTGSNANLLSSEISTSLTGRNKVIVLYPFSFKEYLNLNKLDFDIDSLTSSKAAIIKKFFNSYFEKGGFPLVDIEEDIELIDAYFKDILYRDIIAKYNLTQVDEIKQIGIYFAGNVGKLFSYSSLQKITGVKSLSSIKSYLEYYAQSYLFFYLKKYDFSVSKQILNPKKVYTVDQGIASRIGFNFSENKGRILENIVFLELLRRGKEVYYYSDKKECDFVIKKATKIIEAIQVCFLINKDNEEREYSGLSEAISSYELGKGKILTYDQEYNFKMESKEIEVLPVWKWLLEDRNN